MSSTIVQDLLDKKGIAYKVSGKDFLISCLNPEHEDNNPSCRVDRVLGIFHCLSCGYRGNLFKHFGILTSHNSIRIQKLRNKLKELDTDFNGVTFPYNTIPFTKKYREISSKTLKEFEAFYTVEKQEFNDRIFFPIKDLRNKNIAYIGRHLLSNVSPKYYIYPSGASLPIYPEKLKTLSKSLILVEGIFDMLRLYDNGLTNVACTFGTSTLFKNTAEKLLPFKSQGVTNIYIMFDGDDPGIKAAEQLKPLIEEAEYTCEIIYLEKDKDPGDLTIEEIEQVKNWIYK